MASIKYDQLYENGTEFFSLNGNHVMRLSVSAAKTVCEIAEENGYIIDRIEGGIWQNPGFGSRLDCIWDRNKSLDNNVTKANEDANRFVSEESDEHNVFIISASIISR